MARRGVVVTAAVVLSLCLLAFVLSDPEDVSGVSETIRLRVGKWWRQDRQAVGSRPAVESKRAMLSEILTEKAQLQRILAREDRRAKQKSELSEMMHQQEAQSQEQNAEEAQEAQRDVLMDEDEIDVEEEQNYRAQEARTKHAATINTKVRKAQPQEKAQVRAVPTEVKMAVRPKTSFATHTPVTKHDAKLQHLLTAAAKTPTVHRAPTTTAKAKVAAHSKDTAQTKPSVVQKFLTKVVGAPAAEKSAHNDAQEIVMEPDYQAAAAVIEGLPTKRPALPPLPPLKKAQAAMAHKAREPATKAKNPVAMPPVPHSEKPAPEVVSPASGEFMGHSLAWYLIWGTVASLCLSIVAFVLCYACNLCQGQRSSPWGLAPKRMYG